MMKANFLWGLLLLLAACKPTVEKLNTGEAILGLASVVQLGPDSTTIYLEDYFLDVAGITELQLPAGMEGERSDDGKTLLVRLREQPPVLSTLGVLHQGQQYHLLLRRSRLQSVKMQFDPGDAAVQQVHLVGEINGWNPEKTPLQRVGDRWELDLQLEPGSYPYQWVVDGQWQLDAANPLRRDNGIGGYNSVLEVKPPAATELPLLRSIRSEGPLLVVEQAQQSGELLVFWQNVLLPASAIKALDSGRYEIRLPAETAALERSFVRVYAHNAAGESNDLLIPLHQGQVVQSTGELEPADLHSQVMYFVMVDRFHNGNPDNDRPVVHPEVHEKANYWGGDLKGITQKIQSGFFKEIGVNTLWISPITQNPEGPYREWPKPNRMYSGYHGYWPISSSLVDHRLGTAEELKELLAVAHEHGIRVLLDYVANHVHQEHPLMQQHPEWKTQLDLPDGRKNIRIWDEHRLTTWFDSFMPTLDLENPAVIEAMTDSALFWMQEYGFDGFRHDATKHIPEAFWRRLTQKLKAQVVQGQGRSLYQIGETFGSRQLIGSYIGSGMIDGQFDFNLYFDARSVFAEDREPFSRLGASLEESFRYYGHHHLMGNISGNHDLPRFISFASGALRFDEDPIAAGWERDVQIIDPVGYAKLQQLLAFISTIPGVPVIYAGDDIGMVGAGDPDNRRPMKFESWTDDEASTRYRLQMLMELRRNSLALNYGETEMLHQSDQQLAYLRSFFGDAVLICFNKSAEPATLNLPLPGHLRQQEVMAHFGNPIAMQDGQMLITTLAPYSFEIITFK